ncbi:hypothetical protein CPB85DRAFT_1320720, partial [Mucidula mucida]
DVNFVDCALAHFSVTIPGIRENHPYLEPGDLLHMREVNVVSRWGTGQAFEGRIVALRKREGIIRK